MTENKDDHEALVQVVGGLISDHPMWQGVDYTMERERRISEFCFEVAGAVLDSPFAARMKAEGWDEGCCHTDDPTSVIPCSQNPYRAAIAAGRGTQV